MHANWIVNIGPVNRVACLPRLAGVFCFRGMGVRVRMLRNLLGCLLTLQVRSSQLRAR